MLFGLRQLEYFVAAAEELNFRRAAARIHITQPALSEQIRHLEAALEVPLLIRTTRMVRLTEPGRVFLAQARLIAAAEALAQSPTRVASSECTPKTLQVQVNAQAGLDPVIGQPVTLQVTVVDDCSNPVSAGAVQKWSEVFPNATCIVTLLDRLLHTI